MTEMLVNLTCHEVRDLDSGFVAGPARYEDVLRLQRASRPVKKVMDSYIYEPVEELVGNIPPKKDGVYYIVSKKVAEYIARSHEYSDRDDFVYPTNIEHQNEDSVMFDGYGEIVKDSKGNPVTHKIKKVKGCHGFETLAKVSKQ